MAETPERAANSPQQTCCGQPAESEALDAGRAVDAPHVTGAARTWVIKKGAFFYRPDRSGYTEDIQQAGLYTEREARAEATVEPWHMTACPASYFIQPPQPGTVHHAEITRLSRELAEAREALRSLRLTARVLLQNAEGCAANHYGEDMSLHGPPGWLADCENVIVSARAALSPKGKTEDGNG